MAIGYTLPNRGRRPSPVSFASKVLWTPKALGAALFAWWDHSDSTTSAAAVGSTITSRTDKSGNSRTLSALTTGPTRRSGVQNGLDMAQFANSNLVTGNVTLPQPFTVANFIRTSAAMSNFESLFDIASSGTLLRPLQSGAGGTGLIQSSGAGASLPPVLASTNYILVDRFSGGSTSSESRNGTSTVYGIGTGGAVAEAIAIGGRAPNVGTQDAYLTGHVGETVLINRALTTGETQQLEGYLAWKWGTVAQLPSNHPFKSSAPTV